MDQLHIEGSAMSDLRGRYLGIDPGGERLRAALKTALAAAAAIAVAALLESATHAFETAASLPGAGVTNHFARLAVLMLGSTTALVATFVGSEGTIRTRAVTSLITAAGLSAGIALGIAVHGTRLLALALLVIVPSVGTWFRRYGARGFAAGFPVHVGYLVGFLLGSTVSIGRVGWITAVVALAAMATFAVGLAFLPGDARAATRMLRSYRARARRVLALTSELMDTKEPDAANRLARRLRRQIIAVNETALVLDVAFAEAAPTDDDLATSERRRALFEHERALVTLARFAAKSTNEATPTAREYARAVVGAASNHDLGRLHRLAEEKKDEAADATVAHYREAARALAAAADHGDSARAANQAARGGDSVEPPTLRLIGGWLPGSAAVNAAASSRPAASRFGDVALTVSTRTALQLAVALTLAVTLGDLLSSTHLLWAVVAVYVTFLGSTSDREQLRKAIYRVAGTVAGVVAGDGVAHLTHVRTVPTLIVILVAIFFMAYFARVHYALVVFAVTVGVAQFYAQAGELNSSLLATRVAETAIGAACAITVGLVFIPLRTAKTAQLALAAYLRALAQVLENLPHAGRTEHRSARGDTRALDASFHDTSAAIRPLTRTLLGGINQRCTQVLRLVDLSHDLGRTIVHDTATLKRAGGNVSSLATIALRSARTARAIAADLDQPKVARILRSWPAETKHERATRGTNPSLHSELEDIEAALTALAALRGIPIPGLARGEVAPALYPDVAAKEV